MQVDPVPHRMKVHLFGARCSPSCAAFALLETAKRFGKLYSPTVSEVVKKGFYVDDCLMTVAEESTGVRLVKDLRELLARGGFHLTKWISNSDAIVESIEPEERAKVMSPLDLGDPGSERVLGMKWSVSRDTLEFHVSLPDKPATRRGVLSVLSSLSF